MANESKDIYLMGICGTGVGALAGFLKAQGHRVRGSDANIYPPMSDKLREWGIEVLRGYEKTNLAPHPDLVIVGNVIRQVNPEATYVREERIPALSMPQAIAQFGIGKKKSIVVAGTHGKTSTSALTAHILLEGGLDPSFIVGGALIGYPESFRVGGGDVFVIEGDEYDTAYFDKGPKFLHYRPTTAIITSLEFDHADIFDGIEVIEEAFAKLIDKVPDQPDSNLIVWRGAVRAHRMVESTKGSRRVCFYDLMEAPGVSLWAESIESGPNGLEFTPVYRGARWPRMRVNLWGDFAVLNALAAMASAYFQGMSPSDIQRALGSYLGVKRRLEVRLETPDRTVVDDFGHHPTAIRETLKAARTRWPGQRLWALFEPRSATSRRNIHQAEFTEALELADFVIVGSHARLNEIPAEERFSPAQVAATLKEKGGNAWALQSVEEIVHRLEADTKAGDVVLVFSNGDFGGLIPELVELWS